jgi:hypothetical protein
MNNENELKPTNPEIAETDDRREALKKLGKYAAYVAPFTVMAVSAKAATGSGPSPSSRSGGARR